MQSCSIIEDACGDHTAAPLGLHFAAIHVADWRGEGYGCDLICF